MTATIGLKSPRLSIIIPARNEALRLPSLLEQIACYLAESGFAAEVIVVDNGSTDATSDVVREFAIHHAWLRIKLIAEPGLGRFTALLAGIWQGKGDILFLCDADLAKRVQELKTLLMRMAKRRDIARDHHEGTCLIGEQSHQQLIRYLFKKLRAAIGITSTSDAL